MENIRLSRGEKNSTKLFKFKNGCLRSGFVEIIHKKLDYFASASQCIHKQSVLNYYKPVENGGLEQSAYTRHCFILSEVKINVCHPTVQRENTRLHAVSSGISTCII